MLDLQKPEQFKEQVRASFDATSLAYGTRGDYHWEFAKRLIDRAPLAQGQTILDAATGTAPAALMAAQIIGPDGKVIGVDLSPGILKIAQANIAAADVTNVLLQVGDAEHLMFEDGSFDGVLCSSAVPWFPSIPRTLREWHRVLQPGGWIAFSCFGGGARASVVGLLSRLLVPYGQTLPELNTRLNSSVKCCQLVQDAGFDHVTVSIGEEQQFPIDPEVSFEQAWAGRTRFNIDLPPAHVARLKVQYVAEFSQLLQDQARWSPCPCYALGWQARGGARLSFHANVTKLALARGYQVVYTILSNRYRFVPKIGTYDASLTLT